MTEKESKTNVPTKVKKSTSGFHLLNTTNIVLGIVVAILFIAGYFGWVVVIPKTQPKKEIEATIKQDPGKTKILNQKTKPQIKNVDE